MLQGLLRGIIDDSDLVDSWYHRSHVDKERDLDCWCSTIMCDTRVEQMFPDLGIADLSDGNLRGDVSGKKSDETWTTDILELHTQKRWPKGTSILQHGT